MESTLHRQLKELYGGPSGEQEVRVGDFWIDAVVRGRLIEIQRASLSGIRVKVAKLLESHRVTIVKPLAARTYIVRRDKPGGEIISARYSPLRRSILNVFDELVHFGDVFPHPKLTFEIVMIEQEESRISRRKKRFNGPDFAVEDGTHEAHVPQCEGLRGALAIDVGVTVFVGRPGDTGQDSTMARAEDGVLPAQGRGDRCRRQGEELDALRGTSTTAASRRVKRPITSCGQHSPV